MSGTLALREKLEVSDEAASSATQMTRKAAVIGQCDDNLPLWGEG